MAEMITKLLHLRALAFLFFCLFVFSLGEELTSCNTTSYPDVSGYRCSKNESQCGTFAVFFTNSYYSSLFNLSFYLGFNRYVIADANGFSAETEFLLHDQPLLIPIDCKCKGGFYSAEISKTTIKGESFYGIAQSLEGLTTCMAISDKNPGVSPWDLDDDTRLLIPLRCACPLSSKVSPEPKLVISYPVTEGDTVHNLASKFNTTAEAIISANSIFSRDFNPAKLTPFTSLLIPLNGKPVLGSLAKPKEPSSGNQSSSITAIKPPHRKPKTWKGELYIGLAGVVVGLLFAFLAAFAVVRLRNEKKEKSAKRNNLELQHLDMSVRTTSDKKVSFEGSHYGKIIDTTPRKMLLETYTIEDLGKATEDFSSSNLIEGPVFHGRLEGKNMAIKQTHTETVLKIDMGLFHNPIHHHPNILRMLGTCLTEGPESYLVFEYAKNGSLKDWLHGGLAIKNEFISSCYCFLEWSQRLRICLDVAMALQYMHHVMNPSYVHRNIKSRNIFLDEEFGAKIGNFGMAGCAENETEDPKFYSTNPASWSLGYLAPEYVHQGAISTSTDIFAYGVVLLEVLSGQTPISRPIEKGEGSVWLTDKIKSVLKSESEEELRGWMDKTLGENYSFDAAVTVANIARACVEEDYGMRPSAGEVVEKLTRLVKELPEEDHMLMSESSSKPLVKAPAKP
ncbi:protein LYK2-like [Neltuma alba]|uniref:protein LYK2-like n=1 Tax=Neltuma alba TaxID=207710 RepID=UPI0010A53A73|nr:protein LYK2-like [Prosopis alba]